MSTRSESRLFGLFDRVFVISAPGAADRRAHVQQHLPRVGISRFEVVDGVAAGDDAVAEAFDSGSVMLFPPCFRCGKVDCGRPACNNYLQPAQVAVFLSYLKLWKRIAEGPDGTVLVVEDDVRFHEHAPRVFSELRRRVSERKLPFRGDRPCLLRLGWGLNGDHRPEASFRIDQAVRMSNPCHAITRPFARALLDRHRRISHTVDVYQHQQAPRRGEAFTVYPPVASEHSTSTGRFPSLIHPKQKRSAYLRQRGLAREARENDATLASYVVKRQSRPILAVGHPRCGNGFTAALCKQLGVDVGHERLGRHGISSWMFAVEDDANPYALDRAARSRKSLHWQYLICPVRDPVRALPSVMREDRHAPPGRQFRTKHVKRVLGVDLSRFEDPLEHAVWSLTSWMRIILRLEPDLVFRIEDEAPRLARFLASKGLCTRAAAARPLDMTAVNADKEYRGRRYPKPVLRGEHWVSLSEAARDELRWYRHTFGYPSSLPPE